MNGERGDAVTSNLFNIEIDGLTLGQFSSVNGLDMESEVIEYCEGGNNANALKFRGPSRYPNITLERGFVVSEELWNWYLESHQGDGEMPRKDGSIVMLDSDGDTEMARWDFFNGWPCRWVGPALNADDSSTAVEVLEIAHERLEFKNE